MLFLVSLVMRARGGGRDVDWKLLALLCLAVPVGVALLSPLLLWRGVGVLTGPVDLVVRPCVVGLALAFGTGLWLLGGFWPPFLFALLTGAGAWALHEAAVRA